MRCPAGCDATLVMADRQNIEIDYCPSCRGVWLDRGELDKIIERSLADAPPVAVAPSAPPPPPPSRGRDDGRYDDGRYDDRRYDDRSGGYGKPYKKKKKTSFLEDVFDFG